MLLDDHGRTQEKTGGGDLGNVSFCFGCVLCGRRAVNSSPESIEPLQ